MPTATTPRAAKAGLRGIAPSASIANDQDGEVFVPASAGADNGFDVGFVERNAQLLRAAMKRLCRAEYEVGRIEKCERKAGQRMLAAKQQFDTAARWGYIHGRNPIESLNWAESLVRAARTWDDAADKRLELVSILKTARQRLADSVCAVEEARREIERAKGQQAADLNRALDVAPTKLSRS